MLSLIIYENINVKGPKYLFLGCVVLKYSGSEKTTPFNDHVKSQEAVYNVVYNYEKLLLNGVPEAVC